VVAWCDVELEEVEKEEVEKVETSRIIFLPS
jgi:hypothetical protein